MLLLSRKFWNRELTHRKKLADRKSSDEKEEVEEAEESQYETQMNGDVLRSEASSEDEKTTGSDDDHGSDGEDDTSNDFIDARMRPEIKPLLRKYVDSSDDDSDDCEEEREYDDRRTIEQKRLRNKYLKLKRGIQHEYTVKKGYLEAQNLDTRKVESTKRFSTIWQTIIDKYSEFDEEDQGDIVNLHNLKIEANNGHIENLTEHSWEDIWMKTKDDDKVKKYERVCEPEFDPFEDPINLINLTPNRTPSPSKRLISRENSRQTTPTSSIARAPHKQTIAQDPLSLLTDPLQIVSERPSPLKVFKPSPLRHSNSSPLKLSTLSISREQLMPRVTPKSSLDSDPISLVTPSSSIEKRRRTSSLNDDLNLLYSSPTRKKSQLQNFDDPIVLLTPKRSLRPANPSFSDHESVQRPPQPVFVTEMEDHVSKDDDLEMERPRISAPPPSPKEFRSKGAHTSEFINHLRASNVSQASDYKENTLVNKELEEMPAIEVSSSEG